LSTGEGLLRDILHLEIDLTPAFTQPFKTISWGSSWAILRDLAGIWNIPCSRYSECTFQHPNSHLTVQAVIAFEEQPLSLTPKGQTVPIWAVFQCAVLTFRG